MRHGVQYVIMLGMIMLPLLFVSNKDFLLMVWIHHFVLILIMIIFKVLLLLKIDIAPLSCQQILSLSPVVVLKTQ